MALYLCVIRSSAKLRIRTRHHYQLLTAEELFSTPLRYLKSKSNPLRTATTHTASNCHLGRRLILVVLSRTPRSMALIIGISTSQTYLLKRNLIPYLHV